VRPGAAPEPFDQKALFKDVRGLRKAGREGEAVERLVEALRRARLDAEGVLHAGRLLDRAEEAAEADVPRVRVLGQCTTSWLVPALRATAAARRSPLRVEEEDYDNVLQGLLSQGGGVDAVVLVPWNQRLLGAGERTAAERVADEVGFWREAWSIAARGGGTRIVQVGYDCADPGASGHHLGGEPGGDLDLVRRVNRALREHLPAGAYFVDLEQVAGQLGRDRFYDGRRYFWTRQPFSEAGGELLARHLFAGVRATLCGPKKVLVLDLDDTLWGGVVGETGARGIEISETPAGEAHRDFQRYVKALAARGVLLAVCSKNNPDDAREPFEKNEEMLLGLADFAAFEASWEPKAGVIERIAAELRLGLDSFVFFDDSPAEREQVRQALPDVEVVDVPADPAEYRRALAASLFFEAAQVTAEDAARTRQYAEEALRARSRSAGGSIEGYLASLEMQGEVTTIAGPDLDRVVQLIGKTNQFNLTTRRHTREEVVGLLDRPRSIGLCLRMRDRFGDYGLVSVLLGVQHEEDADALRLDTWLMSCRVIGRSAEHFLWNALLERARALGYERLVGEYVPTAKNAQVGDLFERLGCARRAPASGAGAGALFDLRLADAGDARTFVHAAGAGR